jgi:plasmid stabilization system protein ParE
MPVRLVWREEAESHLQAIFDYISSRNPRAAEAYLEDIVGACDRLRSFPASGRKYDDRYRVLIVRNHLVFYQQDADAASVSIVAIIDGRRDVMAALDDLPAQKD